MQHVEKIKQVCIICFLYLCILFVTGKDSNLKAKSKSPGKLSRVHGFLSKECQKCHTKGYRVAPSKCLKCHKELTRRIKRKRGYHRDKKEDCDGCHGEHQGRNHKLYELDVKDFDHSETGYRLKGKHKKVSHCRACHRPPNSFPRQKAKSYLLKSRKCKACHQSPHSDLKIKCTDCHTSDSWKVDIW